MKDELISAAIVQFEAQHRRAEANLRVYLNYPVGVPEHPDAVAEVMALTKIIAEAQECIDVLKGLQDA
jgi:hypothetical protein